MDEAPAPWSLPAAVATMVIGRAVDPLGDLTLSQLAVVAALCRRLGDRAFDDVAVSMEHLESGPDTLDASGTRRVATGPYAADWAPSRLHVAVAGATTVHSACLLLASFERQGAFWYLREPALHWLLGEQMRAARADALARADDATGRTLSEFLRRLSRAIVHGADPAARSLEFL